VIIQRITQDVSSQIRNVWDCTTSYNDWINGNIFFHAQHGSMSYYIGRCFMSFTYTQTNGQLLFAVAMTIYIFIAVLYLEERDLVHHFGSQYEEYKETTPAFIPSLWRSHKSASD